MFDPHQLPPVRTALTTKAVAKYALLPGIFPRFRRLADCLNSFLFMFTQIMGSTGLIDPRHPCLRYENRYDYPFSYVLSLAWHNVGFNKRQLPQLFMFSAILMSILLLIGSVVGILGKFFLGMGKAHAQYFGDPTQNGWSRNDDWAFQFLDRIFGDSSITGAEFWTTNTTAQNGWFTHLFVGMMQHYSQALLFIAALMILYLLVITIAESARTGQPFGTRFDSVWAPIRLAMAIGLLIPISGAGYNTAQLIVFQASEWGSNLATNVWHAGLDSVANAHFISVPVRDKPGRFMHDMLLINVCATALGVPGSTPAGREDEWPIFKKNLGADNADLDPKVYISSSSGEQLFTFGADADPNYCGQVVVPTEFGKIPMAGDAPDMKDIDARRLAPPDMTTGALNVLNGLVRNNRSAFFCFSPAVQGTAVSAECKENDTSGVPNQTFATYGGDPSSDYERIGAEATKAIVAPSAAFNTPLKTVDEITKWDGKKTPFESFLNAEVLRTWLDAYGNAMAYPDYNPNIVYRPYQWAFNPAPSPNLPANVAPFNAWVVESLKKDSKHGWTTAGVFYLRLSNAFALLEKAVEPPVVKTLPKNFTKFYAVPAFSTVPNEFLLAVCSMGLLGRVLTFGAFSEACNRMEAAIALTTALRKTSGVFTAAPVKGGDLYKRVGGAEWTDDTAQPDSDAPTNSDTSTIFGSVSTALVGAVKMDSDALNPLSQVIRWGNNLMSIASILYIIALTLGNLSPAISSLGITLGHSFMIPGFILAFYVPMQPFLYFMFAVIEWIISVVEAVIGMPLWALSFISLEGDALGKSMNGVKMIFELVLRPTIIVIALIVSVLVFSASIKFVNDSFMLFLNAKAAADDGQIGPIAGAVGGFAMMLIYMFLIYSLATSCFKLIDQIPNNFGRWLDLPQGFGSMIKVGEGAMGGLGGAVASAAVLHAATNVAKAGSKFASGQAMSAYGLHQQNKGEAMRQAGEASGDAAMAARGQAMAERGNRWQDTAASGDIISSFSQKGGANLKEYRADVAQSRRDAAAASRHNSLMSALAPGAGSGGSNTGAGGGNTGGGGSGGGNPPPVTVKTGPGTSTSTGLSNNPTINYTTTSGAGSAGGGTQPSSKGGGSSTRSSGGGWSGGGWSSTSTSGGGGNAGGGNTGGGSGGGQSGGSGGSSGGGGNTGGGNNGGNNSGGNNP